MSEWTAVQAASSSDLQCFETGVNLPVATKPSPLLPSYDHSNLLPQLFSLSTENTTSHIETPPPPVCRTSKNLVTISVKAAELVCSRQCSKGGKAAPSRQVRTMAQQQRRHDSICRSALPRGRKKSHRAEVLINSTTSFLLPQAIVLFLMICQKSTCEWDCRLDRICSGGGYIPHWSARQGKTLRKRFKVWRVSLNAQCHCQQVHGSVSIIPMETCKNGTGI